jgi:hypothetical protein
MLKKNQDKKMREEIDNKLKQNLVSQSKTIADLTRQLDNLKRKV